MRKILIKILLALKGAAKRFRVEGINPYTIVYKSEYNGEVVFRYWYDTKRPWYSITYLGTEDLVCSGSASSVAELFADAFDYSQYEDLKRCLVNNSDAIIDYLKKGGK